MPRGWLRERIRQRWIAEHAGSYWRYYAWRRGPAEPELALLPLLCRSDEVAVDVGANIGLYTHPLRLHAGSVHAFEPIPKLARQLRRAFRRYPNQVHIHPCGLSDRAGSAELKLPVDRGRYGYATIETDNDLSTKAELANGFESIEIEIKTLDDFGFTNVGLVKIDVEGHEVAVLAGATQLIEDCKPTFVVEVEERHKLGSVNAVQSFLVERGYTALFLQAGQLRPFVEFDPATQQDESRPADYVRNFIFVAPSRHDRVERLLSPGACSTTAPSLSV